MPSSETVVRNPRSEKEWLAIRELCCLTGNDGAPIDRARWPFFGEYWIGPYQKLLPRLTFVALSGGQVRGYLTGCADTRRFERQKLLRFHPRFLARVALGGPAAFDSDARRYLKRLVRLERAPNRCFGADVLRVIASDFPAHLHVNVDVRARGQGLGARLVERFASELRMEEAEGVHVFCGANPVRFYTSLGFEILSQIEFTPRGAARSVPVFALGRRLS